VAAPGGMWGFQKNEACRSFAIGDTHGKSVEVPNCEAPLLKRKKVRPAGIEHRQAFEHPIPIDNELAIPASSSVSATGVSGTAWLRWPAGRE